MLIQRMKKGNLPALTFFMTFLGARIGLQRESFGLLLLNFGINKGYQCENRS
jgi:hypothetical protein